MSPALPAGVLALDESSALVRADAALRLGDLQACLHPRALHLGALPVESLERTVGEALADPRPSEATPRGRLIDRCAAVEAELPGGAAVRTRLAPRKATGPDYAAAFLGARGRTGRITAAWLRLSRRPPYAACHAFAFSDGDEALARLLGVLRSGVRPAEALLFDEALLPAALQAALREGGAGPRAVLLALEIEGARELCQAEEATLVPLVAGGAGGGRALPRGAAEDLLRRRPPLSLGERFLPSAALAAAWSSRGAPSMLCGLMPGGAALRSAPAALPTPPPASPVALRVREALVAALAEEGERHG